jgi:UPF0716 family protein affecting phage T7 exclusion
MNTAKRIATVVLFLPIAEIVVFVLVAMALGFWAALLLVLTTSMLGWLLLRLAGQAHVTRVRNTRTIELTADATGRGLALALAGILLLLPGFITDVVGLLVLLPATRRRIGAFLNGWMTRTFDRAGGDAQVVDLAPDQWRSHTEGPASGTGPRPAPRTLDHSSRE